MEFTKEMAVSKLRNTLTELTTVQHGDTYWRIAESLLCLNGKEASASAVAKVSAMLQEESKSGRLVQGQCLLGEVLEVRKRSSVVKRELNQFAEMLLKAERENQNRSTVQKSAAATLSTYGIATLAS